jgi:cytidine deaminase
MDQIAELLALAAAAAERSYSPYSKFRVGAAILLDEGSIFTGCNVENASYRLTTCAEQTAIAKAVSEAGPAIRVRAVAVANLNGSACMPCGACRQTLWEFGSADTWVFFPGEDGPAEVSLGGLLPCGFRLAHD